MRGHPKHALYIIRETIQGIVVCVEETLDNDQEGERRMLTHNTYVF